MYNKWRTKEWWRVNKYLFNNSLINDSRLPELWSLNYWEKEHLLEITSPIKFNLLKLFSSRRLSLYLRHHLNCSISIIWHLITHSLKLFFFFLIWIPGLCFPSTLLAVPSWSSLLVLPVLPNFLTFPSPVPGQLFLFIVYSYSLMTSSSSMANYTNYMLTTSKFQVQSLA